MNAKSTSTLLALLLFFRLGIADTCAGGQSNEPIHLTARLMAPLRIELKWNDPDRNVGGHIVEWATETNGEYTILAFCRPEVMSFVHPDLAPDMMCYYRVRPYVGPVSDAVDIKTGKAVPDDQFKLSDPSWAEPKTNRVANSGSAKSIRTPAAIAAARPTGLQARLLFATGIQLTWVDHASDEEGFLLETKFGDMRDFNVCAVVPPDVNSFGYPLVPAETKASFRIRAFYYGKPSNTVLQTSGPEPATPPH